MRARGWGALAAVLFVAAAAGITTGSAGAAVPVRGTFTPYEIEASLDSFENTLAGDAVGAV